MDIREIIHNIGQSKIFISIISMIFSVLLYRFYLYVQKLRSKYDFSDELYDVVNNYIKTGEMSFREYTALIRIFAQLGNYAGVYREHVQRMIKEFGENGGLNFAEGLFDEKEKEKPQEPQNNDLDKLLKENLALKKQLLNSKRNLVIEAVDDDETF